MSKYHKPKSHFTQVSHLFMAAALFTLTLFCRGKIIHGVTYFDNAGQRSPVRDIATVMQYHTRAACSSHCARPEAVAVYMHAVSLHASVIYRELHRHHTWSHFADRCTVLWSGCSRISFSTQPFLLDYIYRPTVNGATELGVQQSTWVGLMLWVAQRLDVHGKQLTVDSPELPAVSTHTRHGLVDQQPERWRAANTGTDKPDRQT